MKTLLVLAFACTLFGGSVSYTYDAAGRLVKADYGSGGSIVYTYDSAGNLTSRTTTSASTVAAAGNAKAESRPAEPAKTKVHAAEPAKPKANSPVN